ncbi:flagellar protein FlgN [Geomicrobium sp. JSM 1781026]|uniref:flagellar protein FlgN n=1 Tax=unclassified Geomicrobium TaxID=2628951 RepID=UPI0005A71F65|nr:flagellar protein FlgN [Geomicrobium sp. JCM 19037]
MSGREEAGMSVVNELANAFEQLEQRHLYLLELAERKTEEIKQANVKAIQEVVKFEREQVKEVRRLERDRQQMTARVMKEFVPHEPSDVPMSEWVNKLPDEEQSLLTQRSSTLLAAIERLKERNELNQELLSDSLAVVQSTLQMIQPDEEAIAYAPAGSSAKGKNDYQRYSAFDSKA